jgi:hypothetical protein
MDICPDVTAHHPCACGCGARVAETWAPGHDGAAVYKVIREVYGTPEDFAAAHGITETHPGTDAIGVTVHPVGGKTRQLISAVGAAAYSLIRQSQSAPDGAVSQPGA